METDSGSEGEMEDAIATPLTPSASAVPSTTAASDTGAIPATATTTATATEDESTEPATSAATDDTTTTTAAASSPAPAATPSSPSTPNDNDFTLSDATDANATPTTTTPKRKNFRWRPEDVGPLLSMVLVHNPFAVKYGEKDATWAAVQLAWLEYMRKQNDDRPEPAAETIKRQVVRRMAEFRQVRSRHTRPGISRREHSRS